jgi:hypothetical protein
MLRRPSSRGRGFTPQRWDVLRSDCPLLPVGWRSRSGLLGCRRPRAARTSLCPRSGGNWWHPSPFHRPCWRNRSPRMSLLNRGALTRRPSRQSRTQNPMQPQPRRRPESRRPGRPHRSLRRLLRAPKLRARVAGSQRPPCRRQLLRLRRRNPSRASWTMRRGQRSGQQPPTLQPHRLQSRRRALTRPRRLPPRRSRSQARRRHPSRRLLPRRKQHPALLLRR